jgi:hypothetical protein
VFWGLNLATPVFRHPYYITDRESLSEPAFDGYAYKAYAKFLSGASASTSVLVARDVEGAGHLQALPRLRHAGARCLVP